MKLLLLELILFQLSFVAIFYFNLRQSNDKSQFSQTQGLVQGVEANSTSQSFPIRLKIPSIEVDTVIEYVGVTSTGVMEAPDNSINVGWFQLGPRPGELGSAVIAGHFDGKLGEEGVFAKLYKLKKGDFLFVNNNDGTTPTFVVTEIRVYDSGYADEVFNQSDGAHLNLITCDGVWDGENKSFTKRLVVFADLASR